MLQNSNEIAILRINSVPINYSFTKPAINSKHELTDTKDQNKPVSVFDKLRIKMASKRRIGIVGYGHLGQFLSKAILDHPQLELAFVWNRSKQVFDNTDLPKEVILDNLENCAGTHPDLIVEVAHPAIVKKVNYFLL